MYGIIYALLENDIRRILAFSIVNQVGFMVCAVGIGTEMALNGAAAHAFAHMVYKALLFMFARAWPIGTTAFWIAILLITYVLLYFFQVRSFTPGRLLSLSSRHLITDLRWTATTA